MFRDILKAIVISTVIIGVSAGLSWAAVTLGKAYWAYQASMAECITRVDNTQTYDLPIRITICRDRDSRDAAWNEWHVVAARKDFVGHVYILGANLPD